MKWNLGRGIGMVVRCEYDAIMPTQQGKVFINIKALNEWDSKVCSTDYHVVYNKPLLIISTTYVY